MFGWIISTIATAFMFVGSGLFACMGMILGCIV